MSRDVVQLLVAGGLLRALLIGIAILQDQWAEVPYTDVDYRVFSEAAECVARGLSPYEGCTPLLAAPETRYRYSPLLAYALLPAVWFHPAWGKVLFSLLDLVAAGYLARWLHAFAASPNCVRLGLAIWLFNPFTFTISTRGSSEPVVVVLLYAMLDAIFLQRSIWAGAFLFGLAVHFRVYPVVYALPLLLALAGPKRLSWRGLFSREPLVFALVSGSVFLALLGAFSAIYGRDFVHASYLYHAGRVDTKHNFSVYFYPLRFFPSLAGLSLLPQLALCVAMGASAAGDAKPPVKALLLQTLGFVALNRVVTAQYFVWWLAWLPPALPWLSADARLAKAFCLWALAEVHWLGWAYLLEFRQLDVAPFVWLASCVFLAAQCWLARTLARPGRGLATAHS